MLESVPDRHIYKLSIFQPTEPSAFFRIIKKEVTTLLYLFFSYEFIYVYNLILTFFIYIQMSILRSSLPDGIIVKSFEDRIVSLKFCSNFILNYLYLLIN